MRNFGDETGSKEVLKMTIIYKAMPGETLVKIPDMEDNIRFSGNDVTNISIDRLDYGRILTLEEIDSLVEININSPGAIISFNRYPEQTIIIKGSFEEIRVKDGNDFYSLHRFASNPTLPLSTIWGALITRETCFENEDLDALLIKTTNIKDLEIKGEWSHISIISDSQLCRIEVKGKRIIRDLVVHKAVSLTELKIRKRVLTCSLVKCPSIESIIGFGDRLYLQRDLCRKSFLSIGGFWHQVPEWYQSQISLLQIPHFNADLTASEVINCVDMGGITIIPYTYDGPGGLCQFSAAFGKEVGELSFGIEITELIQLIEKNPDKGFNAFEKWCGNSLSPFDQYKAMRILSSLIARDFNHSKILNARNQISEMNTKMPKIISGTVNDGNQGGKWNSAYTNRSGKLFANDWGNPLDSIMPFCRIDLEIWLNTNLTIESLDSRLDITNDWTNVSALSQLSIGENSVIRNLLISALSASNSVGRSEFAEKKLTNLLDRIYTNPLINTDPFCCEFLIHNLEISRVATKSNIHRLVDAITSMHVADWKKVALLVGIITQTNSPRARIAIKRLAASRGISLSESTTINAISVMGKKAFEKGKVAKPEWPYLKSWQKQNKK
jgi:hypothetical protein